MAGIVSSCKRVQSQRIFATSQDGALYAVARFCSPFHAQDMQGFREPTPGVRPGRLITVGEAAGMLRVSTATVYRLCEEGRLPHVRITTHAIRFSSADLAAFVAEGRRRK